MPSILRRPSSLRGRRVFFFFFFFSFSSLASPSHIQRMSHAERSDYTAGYATRQTSRIPSREREGLIPVLPQVPAALHPNFPSFPLLLIPLSRPH
ncbi:hypothetical protein FQN60_001582 [Etheostoma spectabile]|uniref:Secreted protein n=1 Tax=Etheostoma spectabile TaxID=54343 RepID=A0A5J5D0W4_9PERO|nr:hypothetical protein FQN60_001582 [Etheostoma spectabile]